MITAAETTNQFGKPNDSGCSKPFIEFGFDPLTEAETKLLFEGSACGLILYLLIAEQFEEPIPDLAKQCRYVGVNASFYRNTDGTTNRQIWANSIWKDMQPVFKSKSDVWEFVYTNERKLKFLDPVRYLLPGDIKTVGV